MKHKNILFIMILAICCSGLASAQLPYYVDSNGNTWINVSTTGTTPQYYTVSTTGGPAPSGTATFPVFDDFSKDGGVINSNLWSTQYKGSTSGTAAINGTGALILDGTPVADSSETLQSTYQWSTGSELILNESRSNGFYSDTSFGSGSLISAGGWYHTLLGTNGGCFLNGNGFTFPITYRDSSAPTTVTTSTYTYNTGALSTNGVSLNKSFTVGYSYDSTGNASERLYTTNYPDVSISRVKLSVYDCYGLNEVMHPDVYYNNSSSFISVYHHPYWMANTPYWHSVDTVENPQLVCSDDGLTWNKPDNVTDPIAPEPNNTYYHDDDTDMIYNKSSGKLEVYYIVTHRSPYAAQIQQRTFDGITVSEYTNLTGVNINEVSPAFIRNSDGTYDMWCVNNSNAAPKVLYHYTSTDGINWANEQLVSFTPVSGMDLWHFNVQKYNGGYLYMMTFCTSSTSGSGAKLYIGTSTTPTSGITTQADKPLIAPEASGAFDDNEIYRSCSITDGNGIEIYYSGDNAANDWFTALAYATQNSTGYWSIQPLVNSPVYSAYANSAPPFKAIMAQTGSGAQNHTIGSKVWAISQGDHALAGYGGPRYINTAWIRNTTASDSTVSFTTINGKSVMVVTPPSPCVYAQLEIPSSVLITSQTMDIEPMAAPTAAFTSSNTSNVFSFTDTSVGATSWLWDFGDGQTSTVQSPTHTYMANGTYTVSLTATNLAGSNQITHSSVVLVPIAHAGFTQTNNSNVFTFTDISTNNPTSWLWNFGDGQISTLQNPTHTYTANGTYTVTLNASNVYGYTIAITSVQVTLPPVQTAKSMAFDSIVPIFALFGILPFILVVGAILIGVRTKNYNIMFTMCGIAVVVFLIIVFGLVVLSAFNNV